MVSGLVHIIGLASALLSFAVWAEAWVDPTRPPAQIGTFDAPVASAVVSTPSHGLQSILMSKKRRAAIIDGKTIELGQLYGDARLVEVNESSVVLVGTQGRRELRLFPEVNMIQKVEKQTSKLPSPGVQADQNNNPPVQPKEQK
ncbi:MAG: hypothetical protein WAO71_16050 [Gallionella sp.]